MLGLIIFGGIRTIARVAEYVVPFMAIGYVIIALVVVVINADQLPEVFATIFSSAFGLNATFAGLIGSTISMGVKRGVFSNEAGQGTGPHPAAAAEVNHPANQGLVQSFSVYIDTLFVCTATAFIILSTGMYNVKGPGEELIVNNGVYYLQDGVQHFDGSAIYTQAAVDKALSGREEFDPGYTGMGSYTVAIALFFFAFTTLMAYYYIAETNVAYLTRRRGGPLLMFALKVGILASVFIGCVKTARLAWDLGDLGVGLMAWLNIVAILILQKPAMKAFRDYEDQKKRNLEPTFNPKELGIENADFWEARLEAQAAESERKAV
jgi:AGCS family alanine or glycine:cation symporter